MTEKYGGNTPCVSIEHQDSLVIIDAGTGIRLLGIELAKAVNAGKHLKKIHLFLSHTHWDHIQGLPFFEPAFIPGVQMHIYGSPAREKVLENILEGQMDTHYFPIDMSMFNATLEIHEINAKAIEIGDLRLDWQEQIFHPGGCARYRIRLGDRTMVYASDIELDQMTDPPENFQADPQWGHLDLEERARLLAEFKDFIRGADLLIGDGQYSETEYTNRRGWGHSSIPTVAEIAIESEVKQLAVFHHEPRTSDSQIDDYGRTYGRRFRTKETSFNLFWAREGMTIAV
jgi:phosphoribosyl 1,2-cyclic phosphodiesterase